MLKFIREESLQKRGSKQLGNSSFKIFCCLRLLGRVEHYLSDQVADLLKLAGAIVI